MASVADIHWGVLALFFSTLIVPLALSRYYQLKIEKELVISVLRMTVQLVLVGVYLEYLFKINNLAINICWLSMTESSGSSDIS